MLEVRSYESFGIEEAADMIRHDIAVTGFSDGWKSYSLGVLADMEKALSAKGIVYVDDMFGRWERCDARKPQD